MKSGWPGSAGVLGLVPALFALAPLASLGAVLKLTGADNPKRLNQLAWFGAAALAFITLIFPIQFERQWLTVAWALEGAALLWLFHRVPHGAELTAAGEAFLSEAKASLASAEKAKLAAQRANRGETGRLALGFTASSAFNPVVSATIRRFQARWPDVRLSLTELNTLSLMEKLHRGELDATFMRPSLDDPPGVRLKRLADEPMVVALPASHPLAKRETLPLALLATEPFILFPRLVGLSLFDDVVLACRKAGFELTVAQEAPQISSVVNLVAAELGVRTASI